MCQPNYKLGSRQLDVAYISTLIRPLKRQPVQVLQPVVAQVIGSYTCSYKKAWLAKQRKIAVLFNDWVKSYNMLPPYMDSLHPENIRTLVVWRFEEGSSRNKNQLQRVLWSFVQSIEGFCSCRPIIDIDDTHFMVNTVRISE